MAAGPKVKFGSPTPLEEEDSNVAFHVDENAYESVEFVSGRDKKKTIVINNTINSKKVLVVMAILLVIAFLISVILAIALPLHTKSALSNLYSQVSSAQEQITSALSQIEFLKGELFGHSEPFAATSCAALPPNSPSGYYWVQSSKGSAARVYCDMEKTCGGITGGWMRLADLDMARNGSFCPRGFSQRTDDYDLLTCVREDSSSGCTSITVDTQRVNYSMVCGSVVAYQIGNTRAFHLNHGYYGLDSTYVDGVSLTYGSPRKHIWTFASALGEQSSDQYSNCPCISNRASIQNQKPPSFVGQDYFCDTGSQYSSDGYYNSRYYRMYTANPLWDGSGCGQHNTCCEFNHPPWFYKKIPQFTTANIEMRVCRDRSSYYDDIAIEEFYIYVQ